MGNWPVTITQAHINSYAELADDVNPLHVNPDFARNADFEGIIAQGPISEALIVRYLVKDLELGGRLRTVEFKLIGPVRVGDSLTCGGRPVEPGEGLGAGESALEVWCQNQKGETVTTGRAIVASEVGG